MEQEPNQIAAGEFKAHCLRLINEVYKTGKPLIVTKRGKPMVELVPKVSVADKKESLFGDMAGSVTIHGDIFSSGEEWDVEFDEDLYS